GLRTGLLCSFKFYRTAIISNIPIADILRLLVRRVQAMRPYSRLGGGKCVGGLKEGGKRLAVCG
ncbi:MAG: hypothetical protein ACI4B3_11225, partial [Prevotella sp.]